MLALCVALWDSVLRSTLEAWHKCNYQFLSDLQSRGFHEWNPKSGIFNCERHLNLHTYILIAESEILLRVHNTLCLLSICPLVTSFPLLFCFHIFKNKIWIPLRDKICNIYLSASGLFCLTWWPLALSIFLQITYLCSIWLSKIPQCLYSQNNHCGKKTLPRHFWCNHSTGLLYNLFCGDCRRGWSFPKACSPQ